MNQHLYMRTAMAKERQGHPRKRKIWIDYILSRSQPQAYAKEYQALLNAHFPMTHWTDPLCKIERIPADRITSYREQLLQDSRVVRLTFLFGYGAFHSKPGILHTGTVIAQSPTVAMKEMRLQLEKPLQENDTVSLIRVPAKFIVRLNALEDPLTEFRKRFPNILKK